MFTIFMTCRLSCEKREEILERRRSFPPDTSAALSDKERPNSVDCVPVCERSGTEPSCATGLARRSCSPPAGPSSARTQSIAAADARHWLEVRGARWESTSAIEFDAAIPIWSASFSGSLNASDALFTSRSCRNFFQPPSRSNA